MSAVYVEPPKPRVREPGRAPLWLRAPPKWVLPANMLVTGTGSVGLSVDLFGMFEHWHGVIASFGALGALLSFCGFCVLCFRYRYA